jgi:26S proteasome regulatory subunit T1
MRHNLERSANSQGQGPYSLALKKIENELKEIQKRVNEKMGVRESDTGLASANLWDVPADKQRQGQHPLQVARCQTIIRAGTCGIRCIDFG